MLVQARLLGGNTVSWGSNPIGRQFHHKIFKKNWGDNETVFFSQIIDCIVAAVILKLLLPGPHDPTDPDIDQSAGQILENPPYFWRE